MINNQQIERSIITTYRSRIWRKFIAATQEFNLIENGDKIAVCISGGKDSVLMAKCMQELHRHSDKEFELAFIIMDPGYNQENLALIKQNAHQLEIPIEIFPSDIFEVVSNMENNPCYLCARMRRGCLYEYARKKGFNKIALGHHFDDVIETVLLSIMYGSQMQSMPPKLKSTNHAPMELIRPLYFIKENDIIAWANHNQLTFINCACKLTKNITVDETGKSNSKRREIKELISRLKKNYANIDINILRSTYNVNVDTMISYKQNGFKKHFLDHYDLDKKIIKLIGANMDIDFSNPAFGQSECPWNKEEQTNIHQCAVKDKSICPYFCGIKYLDSVLCSYPHLNRDVLKEEQIDRD